VFAGVGSMLAAAFVLIASSRDMTRSAVIQGVFPLITVALLALGFAA
jgi:putative membrane protein